MTPVHSITPFAQRVLSALRRLTVERVPAPCGGFIFDDLKLQMGRVFMPDDELYEAIDELTKAGLIQYCGYDESADPGVCYQLKVSK